MQTYQFASRADEVVYCRTVSDAYGCKGSHGIDPKIKEIPAGSFELKPSGDETVGVGVYATVDIPEGSYLALKEQTRDIFIPPSTYELIYNFTQSPLGHYPSFFTAFLNGYGCGHHYFVSDNIICLEL